MKRLILYTGLFVLLDQIVKLLICHFLSVNETITLLPNFLYITYVQNTGAAFSILEGKQFLFIIIGILIILLMMYDMKKGVLHKKYTWIYALILGGIIGNLIDRVLYAYVIDFIGFILFGNYMPIFNIADTFICVGFFLLLLKEEICKNSNMKMKKVSE